MVVICHYRCLFHRYYAAEFEQTIFVEGDPKNRCNDYEETTYEDCDRKFVKDFFFNNIPNFMPIWATHNYSQVTKFWNTSRRISDMYDDIVTGGTKSGIRVLSLGQWDLRTLRPSDTWTLGLLDSVTF